VSPKDRILSRRAQFVSAALLLSGCHQPEAGKANAVPSSEHKVETKPEPKPPPVVKAPPDRPAFTAKVSTGAEAKRAAAAAKIEAIDKSLEELGGAIPTGCDLNEPACKGRFKVFAEKVTQLREQLSAMTMFPCPAKNADETAIRKMIGEQYTWLTRWLDDIEKTGRAQADAIADAGTAWDDLRADAAKAYAHPCLEFSCPP
jgi:hypothetical protein